MSETIAAHSELVQKILSGTRWVTVFRTTAQIFSWLSTLIVVRFISPEDYGLNTMLEAPLIIIMSFSTLGVDLALIQSKQLAHGELRSVFGFLLLLNTLLFILLFFGSGLLASYYNEPRLTLLGKVLAFIFLLIPFRVIPNALLDRELQFKLKAKGELIVAVLTASSTLTLAYLGAGVWALVIGVLVNRILMALLLMIIKPWFIWPQMKIKLIRKMIAFGSLVTLSGLLAMVSDMLIAFLAGPKIGAEQLGIYGVAATFAMLPLTKGMPVINQTLIPAFAKLQESRESASYYHQRLVGVVALVFIPVIIGTASVAHSFILTVVGENWQESILPLQVMSIGIIFRLSTILYTPVITSMGRVDIRLKISALQLAFLFPLTLISMKYGIVELAASWTATEFIVLLATIDLSKRVINVSLKSFLTTLMPAIVPAIIMGCFIYFFQLTLITQQTIVELLLQVLIGVFTYLLLIRLIYRKQLLTAKYAIFGRRKPI